MSGCVETVCRAAGWTYCADHDARYEYGKAGCYAKHLTDCTTCGGDGLVAPTADYNAGGPGWVRCPHCDGPQPPRSGSSSKDGAR